MARKIEASRLSNSIRFRIDESPPAAAVRFADLMVWVAHPPGVRCAHPGLYAAVRFADCFAGSSDQKGNV